MSISARDLDEDIHGMPTPLTLTLTHSLYTSSFFLRSPAIKGKGRQVVPTEGNETTDHEIVITLTIYPDPMRIFKG